MIAVPVPVGELNAAADVRIKLASGFERSSLGELLVDAAFSGDELGLFL